ncbi:TetR/AcrR family transcriptional regulator [Streptomyces sp. NBC_01803]|uniref:TetR/AcrR family transcriptional regulator n=1 Tax=Streptomyces sp. NBC_01803 TaxID=2975946 RepID=UPI002DD8D944|nr:helix-turn-helix domain-containing protein [Streptomyces sp. NBC_01803]WSA44932.1 TetR/AcrR family transcriptional regulator [Streptomyces sp. NBC_01803]
MRSKESGDDADAGSPGERCDAERHSAGGDGKAGAPLRVDAQRNLRHVLSAARDVFGEQGYGAPMEEVARRARVGVGTVYRRFPNKEALVRYIEEEETQRLAARAREALELEDEPWGALAEFVQGSAASGAGRLLPPGLLAASGAVEQRVPQQRAAGSPGGGDVGPGARELLSAVGQLVERTRAAGELRADVTVADLMLVIATTPPRLDDPVRQTAAETRLLEILLQGLRARGR